MAPITDQGRPCVYDDDDDDGGDENGETTKQRQYSINELIFPLFYTWKAGEFRSWC